MVHPRPDLDGPVDATRPARLRNTPSYEEPRCAESQESFDSTGAVSTLH